MKMLIIFLSLFAFIGCANIGHQFNVAKIETADETDALIYFYRPSRFQGSTITMPVIANDVGM